MSDIGWAVIERVLDDNDVAYAAGIADNVLDALTDEGLVIVQSNTKKLSPAHVRQIRMQHKAGDTQAEIAERYGLNPATVSRIVRGEYW